MRPDAGPEDPAGSAREPVVLEIDSLFLEGSPRLAGEDGQHAQVLAELGTDLPPIMVHRETMRVVDGAHRVRAARLRGESTVPAVFFDGDQDAAFVYAVRANVSHGLPLTLADRRAAAVRILATYPEWSDRAIAAATGLSAATVRALRGGATGGPRHADGRVGMDGRVRPLDATAGRRRAAEVIAADPLASLREIASRSGVSVGTARDVRRRLRNGEDAVPQGARRATPGRAVRRADPVPPNPARHQRRAITRSRRPAASILEGLRSDPSLRYSESGRSVLRWLAAHFVDSENCTEMAERVPPHCAYSVLEMALSYATAWQRLADELAARARTPAVR